MEEGDWMHNLNVKTIVRLFLIFSLFVDSFDQGDYCIRLKLNVSLFCIPISLSFK